MLSTLRESRFTAFVGAGASAIPPTQLPTWNGFNDLLLESLCERLAEYSRDRQPTTYMLEVFRARRGGGRFFAPDFQAQLIEEEVGSDYFRVWQSIDTDEYGPVHAALAELAARGRLSAIVTTNFDRLIETALTGRGVAFEVFHDEPSFSRLAASSPEALPVLKIHGSIEDVSSLVDTLRQRVLGRPRSLMDVIRKLLLEAPWLYLGFSGADFSYDPHYLGILDAAPHARGFVFLARSGSKLNDGVARMQQAYGANKAEVIEGDLNDWLIQAFHLPAPATFAMAGPPPVKERIAAWVGQLGDISMVNILCSLLKSAGHEPDALWLMRKTFRSYRSPADTGVPTYARYNYNYNYGLSLLERGLIHNPVALADDLSNMTDWKWHADQNAFEFLGRAYNQGGLLPAGAALASLMALRGEVGRALGLAGEVTKAALGTTSKSDLCDLAIFTATIYDIVHLFRPVAAQLVGCIDYAKQLGDEPRRARLCAEVARAFTNAGEPLQADKYLAESMNIAERLGLHSVLLQAESIRGLRLMTDDPEAAVRSLRQVRDVLRAQDDVPLYTHLDLAEADTAPVAIKGRNPLLGRVLLNLATAGMLAGDSQVVNQALDELDELTVEWFQGYCPHYYLLYAECLMISGEAENAPVIADLLQRARQVGENSGNPWVQQAAGVLDERMQTRGG